MSGSRISERPRRGIRRRTGCQDVVDQKYRFLSHLGISCDNKATLLLSTTKRSGTCCLLRGPAMLEQNRPIPAKFQTVSDLTRKRLSGIVGMQDPSCPMFRDWNDQIKTQLVKDLTFRVDEQIR